MRIGPRKHSTKKAWDDERFFKSMQHALNTLRQSSIAPYITSVYLYGSSARGDYKYSSDIDLFVVLDKDVPIDIARPEMFRLKGIISPANINDVPVDLHATIGSEWETGTSLYYKNIRKEGVDIWQNEHIGTMQKTTETT